MAKVSIQAYMSDQFYSYSLERNSACGNIFRSKYLIDTTLYKRSAKLIMSDSLS